MKIDIDPTASSRLTVTDAAGSTSLRTDFKAMGIDIVRILLEAVFDAHEGLPALSAATNSATALGFTGGLDAFDSTTAGFSATDFQHMTTLNNRIEAASGILIDRLIRGIGPLSLNNDALEQAIVEVIATTVRKAAEKATWCWYACGLAQEAATLEQDAETQIEKGEKNFFGDTDSHFGADSDSSQSTAQNACVSLKLKINS